ncbi:MAG TPA: Ada metal-binding domain-containing protein, partial [Caulobacteraceae bacterium]|nr:Ada metal-binding domain-containing protein [Caulobacteraceae bacterium]
MTRFTDDDARWAAVQRRDREADGAFLFAVVTTGVYCRPSCSGRPLRRNARFYDTAEAARADAFRACKRCRPDEARETIAYACG